MNGDSESPNPKPASVDRLSLLWRRINEHKIVQWSVAYVALAYAIQHAIILTSESLEWPNTVARVTMLLFALGLPLVMTLAWYHGALASKHVSRAELSIIALLLAVGSLWFYTFVQPSKETAAPRTAPTVQEAGVAAARSASLNPGSAISVAVMPFANLSSDKEQEFFSDGMTEEITTALAKIPDLRVVARESAFQFRGEKKDVRAVGQALGATHLIEGSVRKVGNRVRISAQLVKADDGVNIWANAYDRELTDVFAIQEDIATAIAGALRMPLGLKSGEHLVSNRPADQETYELYLRGLAALRSRSRQELDLLEPVVMRDPNFAPGWAKLSEARREMALYFERAGEASKRPALIEGAEAAAKKALALDPGYAGGYAAFAGISYWRGKWTEAIDLAKHGLALDPEDPELLTNYGETLRALGYLKEGLRVREHLALLEPLNPLYKRQTADLMFANGMLDAGVKQLESLQDRAGAPLYLAPAYARQGRYAEAADVLLRLPARGPQEKAYRPQLEAAVAVLHAAANKSKPPAQLPALDSEMDFVYAYAGVPERMLDWPEKAVSEGDYRPLEILWWPAPSSVRKTERFKALARKAGLVEYWRVQGWPDLCRPMGTDDFVCD